MLHHGGKKIAFLIIENKEAKFPQAFCSESHHELAICPLKYTLILVDVEQIQIL